MLDVKFAEQSKSMMALIEENMREQFDEIRKFVEEQQEEISVLKEENKRLSEQVLWLETRNDQLEGITEEMNQYSRRNNLIFFNVPEIAAEKPLDTIKRISEAMNLNIKDTDIDACHRLPERHGAEGRGTPRPFIVKFIQRIL